MTAATVREQTVRECTPGDRAALARAFVSSHAVGRFRRHVRDMHPNEAVQEITAGLRDHAVRVRDRSSTVNGQVRFDVDIEPAGGAWWVARLVHDAERARLAIETVLAHRSSWDQWDGPAEPGLWLSVITLDRSSRFVRDAVGDICTMHRRVLDLVETHPLDTGARPLWALPRKGELLVRSTEPVTASPSGLAKAVTHLPWRPPDQPGRWAMSGVVNPCKDSKSVGASRRAGKGRGRSLTLYRSEEDVAAWLTRKLPGAVLAESRIVHARMLHGTHHGTQQVHERALTVECTVDVQDPAVLAAAVAPGVGRGKSWGLGLTLWEPVG